MAKKLLRSTLLVLLACLLIGASALVQPCAAKDSPKTLDNDPHLVGWWKLDETSGKIAVDSSMHKRNGALKGELSFGKDSVAGKVGKTLKLDGEGGYIEITKYKGVVGTHARTVTAWIKTTRSKGEVVSWGTDDFGQMFTFCFIRNRVGIKPNGGYYYMNDTIHDGQWHHVAVVIKEVELPNMHDDAVLYKDGVIAEIHDIGLLDLWPIDTGSDLDVRIGRGFKGSLDDVRIYDRVLSDEEVMALFKLESDRPLPKPKK